MRGNDMEKDEWKEKVLRSLNLDKGNTFAKLSKDMGEEGKGNSELLFPGCDNLVLWCGMDRGLAMAIAELYKERAISYCPCKEKEYHREWTILTMPVAYEPKDYAFSHWCPVLINVHCNTKYPG